MQEVVHGLWNKLDHLQTNHASALELIQMLQVRAQTETETGFRALPPVPCFCPCSSFDAGSIPSEMQNGSHNP